MRYIYCILCSLSNSALELLNEASRQGHTKAREQVAMLTLLGGYTADPFKSAYSAFEELSNEGNPRGQFGLGFLYASGLHVNASIPHALIYLTFSALGGDNFADMALVSNILKLTSVADNYLVSQVFIYKNDGGFNIFMRITLIYPLIKAQPLGF